MSPDYLPDPPQAKTGWPWTESSEILPDKMVGGKPWPKISIVTPSYNQGQFLEETIRSVLLQGYPNLEYIIIDGASTDNSVEIIEKYQKWIDYWVSEKDKGQSYALNKGFENATGEIFGWLCSDDLLLTNCLKTVGLLLNKNNCWLAGSAAVMDEKGNLGTIVSHKNYQRGDILYNSYILNQVSVFWNRLLYEKSQGINNNLYYSMDWDLWVQFEQLSKLLVVNQTLGAFRTHAKQKTHNSKGMWQEIYRNRSEKLKGKQIQRVLYKIFWQGRKLFNKTGNIYLKQENS